MLDNLSDGRFMLGIGRGISPNRDGFYSIPSSEMQALFRGVRPNPQSPPVRNAHPQGKYYSFTNVPMTLRPIQRPHPDL
jgi:alkanesulfonate monooxygenase SsuD/methylene tetrahydromethanopterin reductase-like flavin-dependent oxidoreductase (luciferase family)